MKLVPFVFGHGPWLSGWAARIPAMNDAENVVIIDVLDDHSRDFFRLMNAANQKAFGDLGMPAWVQLDCATLPTAMTGLASRKRDLDPAFVQDLESRADVGVLDDEALLPLAEYCALPTPELGHVLGFSFFSLVPGLGVRAKALGLMAMQARVQTGVTQIDNTALRTHCRFGPLLVHKRGVQVHSRPGTTLVYRLQVPDASTLADLGGGALSRVGYRGLVQRKSKASLQAGDVVVDVEGADVVVAVD